MSGTPAAHSRRARGAGRLRATLIGLVPCCPDTAFRRPGRTGSPTASPSTPAASTPAPASADRLAATGADGSRTGLFAGIAALLIGVGIAAFAVVRRRRHRVSGRPPGSAAPAARPGGPASGHSTQVSQCR
ncbi:hypothetical protein GCM10010495_28860 [Kitasatospora herbaricolor]|nr:hypothetical protein GCM10010495_28860 [Kitasatospora herbaricolor]